MNTEIMNDRTDHNRFAAQLAERLQREIVEPGKIEPIRKARKPRAETAPTDAVVAPVAADITPIERVKAGKLEIFDFDQRSEAWFRARLGLPTASEFDTIITPGKTKSEQKSRQTYMFKLAGEILTGQPMESVTTAAMLRGRELEPEARDLYALKTGAELSQIGFIRNGRAGCSPDSLIGLDGGLEIKTKAPHLLIDVIRKDEFPSEHLAQVQGTLWLTEREWWDLAVYWPGLPLFVKRAYRDEAYIANLASEIDRFNADLEAVVTDMSQRIDQEAIGFEFAAKAA